DDEQGCLIIVPWPAGFWGKWLGKQPSLEIDIRLARVNPASATPIDITASLRALRASSKQSRDILEVSGPEVIDRLRQLFLVNSNKRTQSRLLWHHPITVVPIRHGERGEPIIC